MGTEVKLTNVRMAFADIYEAKAFKQGDTPKFGSQFIMEDGSPAHEAVKAAINAEIPNWGDNAADDWESIKHNTNKCCYGSGKVKKKYAGFEADNWWISAKNSSRPTIVGTDEHGQKVTKNKGEQGAPYAGCYVNAIVEIWAQKGENQGMRCSLQGIQFLRDGDAFAGGSVASVDDFDDLSDGADAPAMDQAAGGFV